MLRRVSMLHQQGIGTSAWVQHIQHGSNIQVPSCGEGVRSRLRLPGPAGRLETEGTRDSWQGRWQPTALWHCGIAMGNHVNVEKGLKRRKIQ